MLGDGLAPAAAAATRAAAVEMLKVPLASPPVPQVSTRLIALASVEGQGSGGGAHGVDEAGDLGGVFAAGGERAEERGDSMSESWPVRMCCMRSRASSRERVARPSMRCLRWGWRGIRFRGSR